MVLVGKNVYYRHPESAKLMVTHWNGSSVAGVDQVDPCRWRGPSEKAGSAIHG